MSAHIDNVPKWIRVIIGLFAVINTAFGIISYLAPTIFYHGAIMVDLTNPLLKNAEYQFASVQLAIGLALGFITIIKGAPEALTILTIVLALINIQTIILAVVEGNLALILLVPIAFLILEVFMVKTLVGVIKKEEVAHNYDES